MQARVWNQVLPDQGELAALLSVLIGLAVGALFGALQGYFIAFHNVPSFIVTLGGMFVLTGLILVVTEGKTIPANQPEFAIIAQSYLPPPVGWVLAAVVVAALFWNMIRGRQRKRRYGSSGVTPLWASSPAMTRCPSGLGCV